jgi:serine protease Do
MTIGYPMDLPPTPSFGIVGGFCLKYLGRYFATTHIRANVAVQRGEGGAPLLNMKGEVAGILISSLDRGSASFVLPIEAAEKVRRDFIRFRELRPGYIGIQVGEAKAPVSGSTALVQDLVPGAPGEKAGIKPGDVLLRLAERRITCPEDVLDACYYLTAEDDLTIAVARDGHELEIAVQATDHPGSGRPDNRILREALPPNTLGSMGDLRAPSIAPQQ